MRISNFQKDKIVNIFKDIFKEGEIYLFGSRVDNSKKGGDIDLYLIPKNLNNLGYRKIDFLIYLKKAIGEQKIDVVIDRGDNILINKIAKREGILLWKS